MTVDVTIIDAAGHVLRRGGASSEASALDQAEGDEIAVLERAPDRTKRVGDEWVPLDDGMGIDMAFERTQARQYAAMFVDQARRRYITVIPGQDMVYGAKEDEARSYVAAGSPGDLTTYPMLAAEVGLTAETPDQLAQLWLNMAAIWRQVAAALEPIRLHANASIGSAETKAELDAALSALKAQLDAL